MIPMHGEQTTITDELAQAILVEGFVAGEAVD